MQTTIFTLPALLLPPDRFLDQVHRDHLALDLVGALVDLGDLRVAHHLLDRVLLHVAVAAEDLHRVRGDAHRRVGGEHLGHGGDLRHVLLAAVDGAGGRVRQRPGGLDLGGHVGQHELQALEPRDRLAEGVARIAASFYPKDVIVRLSDFKSNEYANLIGGAEFEPVESNPMIGWRGASRYYDPKYIAAFELECRALVKVREDMGLRNLKIMVPFCRTLEEGKKVLAIMAKHGLKRGVGGLEVYVMCEIPSNVILAEDFCKIFDGFSIGSNDLTQLTLGVDRDSQIVAHVYDERNQAVKSLISQVIKTAKKNKRKIGICGQAPSDFPDFAQFLVREGIDSISLNPDTVIKTTLAIKQVESKKRK